MYSGFDPNLVDTQAASDAAKETQEYIEKERKTNLAIEQQQALEAAALEQGQAEVDDPRNKENWGVGGVVKELQSAITGGLQDTASSAVTLGERIIDTATGEIQEEQATEEGYRTEWDDFFVDDDNPIETRTWWGGLLRGAVHFGSTGAAIAAAITAAAPSAAAAGTAAGIGGVVKIGAGIWANTWGRAAVVGAATDLVSKYSQDANALQVLRDRYGFIDTPLTTNDLDHPTVKTFKNVVEGMGIGELANFLFKVLGKGAKRILPDGRTVDNLAEGAAKGAARDASVQKQIAEAAEVELKETPKELRGHKNKKDVNSWQGAPTSKDDVGEVQTALKRQRTEWGAEDGSPGSLTTPVGLARAAAAGSSEQVLTQVYKELNSNAKFQADMSSIRARQSTMSETWGDALEQWQRTGLGREAADQTPAQFLAEYYENGHLMFQGSEDEMLIWTAKNVVAGDLLVGSLAREIRDLAIGTREIMPFANVAGADGPLKALQDKFVTVLSEVKKQRIVLSDEFRQLGAGKDAKTKTRLQKKFVVESVDEQVKGTIEGFQLAMKLAGESDNDDLFKALFETISMSNDIRNIDDFDHFIRTKLKGGEIKGDAKTGLVIKELQGVMIHSILSGPKTSARALMGTSTATFLRPISTAVGATLKYPFTGDGATIRAALASTNAMRQAIPEAWTLFRSRLNSYWTGDVATIKSRFTEYTRSDEQWDMMADWIENSGRATAGDTAAFHLANQARKLNDNKILTYSTKIMASIDDTFEYILGRAKMREKATREALDLYNAGTYTEITPQVIRSAEDRFYNQVFDADGRVIDEATKYARSEVTLTTDLQGFAKGLNTLFEATPYAKPFFLFARTGVNGLSLTAKHTPGFNFLVKEWNDIAFASADNLANVQKYGINTAEELANAKALQVGRLAIGSSVIGMAAMQYINGGLTGNGPTDRQKRQVWIDAGWKPRSINLGGIWVSYDAFEPFNQIMSAIGDIGDHSHLMGDEWTENNLRKLALVLAQGVASKSYLAGIGQFVDLFAGRPGQMERITAGLLNNQVPMAGLRNELGKLFTPYMRELDTGWGDAFRNRNLISENIASEQLPVKYDMLNGKPIRDFDFMTRMFNMFSPIHFNLDQGPGRKLLFDSGYDLRMSTYYGPDGTDLSNNPRMRSKFQYYIGQQGLEAKLNKLAEDPRIQASLETMHADLRAGKRYKEPMRDYHHNRMIKKLFTDARNRAWAIMQRETEIKEIQAEERRKRQEGLSTLRDTQKLLQLNK